MIKHTREKVGLLGGTFNPVHRGHVDLGLHVYEAFGLDRVLYILSAQPPHKRNLEVAPAALRWRMLKQALAPYPQLEPCDIEVKRPTWSWTIDTVEALKKESPQTDFYFISGSEGFLKIRTWKEYKRLLRALSFIVILRTPSHKDDIAALLAGEELNPPVPVPGGGNTAASPLTPGNPSNANPPASGSTSVYLHAYESEKLGISSTLIRKKVKRSQDIGGLVDTTVKKIMEENSLYEH